VRPVTPPQSCSQPATRRHRFRCSAAWSWRCQGTLPRWHRTTSGKRRPPRRCTSAYRLPAQPLPAASASHSSAPPPLFQGSVRWANCTAAAFDLLLTPECVLLPKPEWWHDGALKTLSKTVVRVVDNGHGHMMRATVLSGLQPAWEVSPRSAADLKEAAKHYSLAAKLASPHGQGHPPSPSGSASAPPQGAPAAAPFRLCGGADLFPGEEERPGQRPGHCAPRHRLVCSSQPVPNSPYPELFRRIRPPRPVVPYRSSNSAIWQPLTSARRPPRKPQRPQRRLQRRRPRPW